jgi:hypothetical protein
MNKKLMFIACFTIICVVGLLIYIMQFEDAPIKQVPGYGKNVRVSDSPLSPIAVNIEDDEKQVTPTAQLTKRPHALKPTPTQVVGNNLHLRLQDAFGYPIEIAEISFLNQRKTVSDGYIALPWDRMQPFKMRVTSKGYEPRNIQIDPSRKRDYAIQLEYLTDYHVALFESNDYTKPVPNAKVTLYLAKSARRPVPDSVMVSASGIENNKTIALTIDRRQNDAMVNQISYHNHRKQLTMVMRENIKNRFSYLPEIPSRIVGFSHTQWEDGLRSSFSMPKITLKPTYLSNEYYASSPLRIWDVLSCLPVLKEMRRKAPYDYLYTITETQELLRTFVLMPEPNDPIVEVASSLTDEQGKAVFEDLEPGIYFAQASLDNALSSMAILHPVRNQVKLSLHREVNLTVALKRRGIDICLSQFSDVLNVNVSIKGLESTNTGLFSTTTDSIGCALFENIKPGKYLLNVDHEDCTPETIVVNEPNEYIIIRVDDGYTISGTIFDQETKEPIPGLTIKLTQNYHSQDHILRIAKNQTGDFIFKNLKPGTYYIELFNKFDDQPYYPPQDMNDADKMLLYYFENGITTIARVDIIDKDVDDVEIFLSKGAKTEFIGKVINQNGEPVVGAYLTMMNFSFEEPDPMTDNQGCFHLVLYGDNYKSKTNCDLYARVGELIERRMIPMKGRPNGYMEQRKHIELVAEGYENVPFMPGDVIKDIVIVVPDEMKRIVGTISTSDQKWPVPVTIIAVQGFMRKKSEINHDGEFEIKGVSPGDITLFIKSEMHEIETGNLGVFSGYDYVPEQIQISYPEDKQDLYLDVVLERAGYIGGYVIAENGERLPGISVTAQSLQDETKDDHCTTNQAGRFLIHKIPREHTYRIDFHQSQDGPVLTSKTDIQPNRDDLLIEMDFVK